MQSVVFFAILAVASAGVITEEKSSVAHEQNPAGFAYQTSEYKSAQSVGPAAVPAFVPSYYAAPAAGALPYAAAGALPYAYSYVKSYEPSPAVAVKTYASAAPAVTAYKFEAPAAAFAAPQYAVKTEYKYDTPAAVPAAVKTEYKFAAAPAVAYNAAPAYYNYAPAAAPAFYKYATAPAYYKAPAAPAFVPSYYNAAPYYGYGYNYGYAY